MKKIAGDKSHMLMKEITTVVYNAIQDKPDSLLLRWLLEHLYAYDSSLQPFDIVHSKPAECGNVALESTYDPESFYRFRFQDVDVYVYRKSRFLDHFSIFCKGYHPRFLRLFREEMESNASVYYNDFFSNLYGIFDTLDDALLAFNRIVNEITEKNKSLFGSNAYMEFA